MAAKIKTVYICSECGYQSAKWMGKCPSCGKWNTLQETVTEPPKSAAAAVKGTPAKLNTTNMPKKISEIEVTSRARFKTGMTELDRVLGGGIVRGSIVLVGGEPGIGKSTLLLQICGSVCASGRVLYVSGEESAAQIKLRAERLGVEDDNIYIVSETDVMTILAMIDRMNPSLVIIDSIQTMHRDDVASAAGSVPQVREAANLFMASAKRTDTAIFMVGHVTKDGSIAGPRVLEHIVDTVLYFEGDENMTFRILRGVKNRFGSTNEIGVFEMGRRGLSAVENPSAALLAGRATDISGSAVVCTMEGTRGVLAEIQALVTRTNYGNPRRMSSGIGIDRLILLAAVLEKRAKIDLSASDIYLNVAGGLRIDDPGIELGICAAIVSAARDIALPADMLFLGEVGLGGELRNAVRLEQRMSEAAKLGFNSAVVPKNALAGVKVPHNFAVQGITHISQLVSMIMRRK